ncbi:MAG: TssQ family T6SS-associated lipoprotein [Betaproteobacteria bacterium]|nr:TssQ family T6SS-associated lipoprotein [Betaproteobacteria bacterium]
MLAPSIFTRIKFRIAGCGMAFALLAACVAPPSQTGPSPEEVAKQQRVDRAQSSFNEAVKQYDAGNYDDSLKNFLLALDSGVLNVLQQVSARKTLAFIHCLSNREPNCKEEFEKAFALDAKFELSPAEAGHPIWGPVYRTVRTELAFRKSGRPVPAAPAQASAAELAINEAMAEYDAAEYNKAIKLFQGVKDSATIGERVKALKFTAFSYCLSGRSTLCRGEFEKIFALQPEFDLEPAEAGHPSWGPSFRAVKAKQKPLKK